MRGLQASDSGGSYAAEVQSLLQHKTELEAKQHAWATWLAEEAGAVCAMAKARPSPDANGTPDWRELQPVEEHLRALVQQQVKGATNTSIRRCRVSCALYVGVSTRVGRVVGVWVCMWLPRGPQATCCHLLFFLRTSKGFHKNVATHLASLTSATDRPLMFFGSRGAPLLTNLNE